LSTDATIGLKSEAQELPENQIYFFTEATAIGVAQRAGASAFLTGFAKSECENIDNVDAGHYL